MKQNPKIYLAIDNCFASKRWTKPDQWAALIASLGIRYVECSADTECDPLYHGSDYIATWIEKTKEACETHGIRVANLYSGHGTYSTIGLAHWDAGVRDRFRDGWLKAQAHTASRLGAGFGFYTHAFDDDVLQDADIYWEKWDELCDNLADVAKYAATLGMGAISLEQMYSPHQVPWTVDGAKRMLRQIYKKAGVPFYLTTDVGHMSGQYRFQKPTEETILNAIADGREGRGNKTFWVGSRKAAALLQLAIQGKLPQQEAVAGILEDAERLPHLFAQPEDGSPYHWLREVGRYSPIIHLQQNDGKSSPHWPFDPAHNDMGIISGESVLTALQESFAAEEKTDMPPAVDAVYLTLEPFIGTAGNNYVEIENIRQSVQYWRQFIPEDGMYLSQLI